MKLKAITRAVWILSIISLCTDSASEMLYPVMPVYLKSIGFSVLLIGILEGLAEATASLSKGYFGKLSDTTGKRVPFVQAGYALSALSKPMMALFAFPLWVFGARTLDRLGKGVRTGARDALLSDEATPETKGSVFGFHRSMDTLGAVLGPAFALVYLYYRPADYRNLFFIAFLPGLLAIAASFFLRRREASPATNGSAISLFSFLGYWKSASGSYRRVVAGFILFALVNSSDLFLLLRAKESGLNDASVLALYIFYNLVYALAAFPLGSISDRWGFRPMFLTGLTLFALVYAGMAFALNQFIFILLFFLYGLYAAATEGVAKAWISNVVEKRDTATAIGTYTALQGVSALLASSVAGWVWYSFGARVIFLFTAVVVILVIVYFLIVVRKEK